MISGAEDMAHYVVAYMNGGNYKDSLNSLSRRNSFDPQRTGS
ncbi:MAG: hypothetical protein ABI416_18475 [Ginsengibacter sp.]